MVVVEKTRAGSVRVVNNLPATIYLGPTNLPWITSFYLGLPVLAGQGKLSRGKQGSLVLPRFHRLQCSIDNEPYSGGE